MAKQVIATGSAANDGTGDTLRSAGTKINSNFTELYDMRGRVTKTETTASINNGDQDKLTFAPADVGKSFVLHEIKPSAASYIKLYTDSDFRIADIGRSTLATPVGEGLITEFVTQADSAVRFTPGILGYTDSDNVLGVSMQVKNLSGGTAAISVRLKALKLEI
tara:strand:+ start:4771 stop:5262 length:492 start_codon:yes stop_codon:yes gene_type:complete